MNMYETLTGIINSREVQHLALTKKGGPKVVNRFIRYAEILKVYGKEYTDYEIKIQIRRLERSGKITWSFRHKKYMVNE